MTKKGEDVLEKKPHVKVKKLCIKELFRDILQC